MFTILALIIGLGLGGLVGYGVGRAHGTLIVARRFARSEAAQQAVALARKGLARMAESRAAAAHENAPADPF